MTDDDELRDDFGDELTDALVSRARDQQAPDLVETVQHRARTRRVRRWTATATVAAAIVVVLVAVAASGGSGKSLRVEETPTSTTTVAPGRRLVSYHGVRVEVPAGWPVLDGMHTQLCGDPFGDEPAAYVGRNDNLPPHCARRKDAPRHDGVWIVGTDPGPGGRTIAYAAGEPVIETQVPQPFIRSLWFRGVSITVGVGPDRAVAQAIVESIGYAENAPDTPASGVCERSPAPEAMPTPERLASRLVLNGGTVILDPPKPTDRAATSAEDVWRAHIANADYEHYRLILARYTSAFPASPNGQGGYTPDDVNRLAWVVYATPITKIDGCGYYGVDAVDATTGQGFGTLTYGPGP